MNFLIEHLNQLGGRFLAFAWPMFWQSSLLILLVWASDRWLARKVRAAVRHALWLAVLVKLLLPPSLALPTGAAWWLFPAQPTVKAPAPRNFVVTVDDPAPLPDYVPPAIPPPPPPTLDRAGWAFLATAAVSLGLLGWLLGRWLHVARLVRRATPAHELSNLLMEIQRDAALRRQLRVNWVAARTSPAVCGLFRPVILLPRMLGENLSAGQLRAVLLHEAVHLRRLDIWTNCAQALLQILYWWHPLVWLANARLRRLREEAVDDAVMLALAGEAEVYAPTLLAVARLAFHRPRLSLGLVGILESRSALRQRIERLVAFHPPRRAGLSLASLSAILAFSAVALPMGQGPAPASDNVPAPAAAATLPATEPGQRLPQVLIQAEIYRLPPDQLQGLVAGLPRAKVAAKTSGKTVLSEEIWWSASAAQYSELSSRLKASGVQPVQRPRIQTTSGYPAQFFVGNDQGGTEIDCRPVVQDGRIQLTFTSELTDRTVGAGSTNRIEGEVALTNHGTLVVPMPEDVQHTVFFLTAEILTNTPRAHAKSIGDGAATNSAPAGNAQGIKNLLQDGKLLFQLNKFAEAKAKFNDVLAEDPANATAQYYLEIVSASGKAPQSSATVQSPQLLTRTFRLDPQDFVANLDFGALALSPDPSSVTNPIDIAREVRRIATAAGVDWGRPQGKSVFYKDRVGLLYVKATESDLDRIERLLRRRGNSLTNDEALHERVFRIGLARFREEVEKAHAESGPGTASISNLAPAQLARELFADWGVDFDWPRGKFVFYNDGTGYLFVKATQSDFAIIEKSLQEIHPWPLPQIHIKARFIELPAEAMGGINGLLLSSNLSATGIGGLLTCEDTRRALAELESQGGVECLGEPEVTVLGGRQVRMRATETIGAGTNVLVREADHGPSSYDQQVNYFEVGPALDVTPKAMEDGYTISLTASPSLITLEGQAKLPLTAYNPADAKFQNFAPQLRTQRVTATAYLWDNQTLVLGGLHVVNYRSRGGLLKSGALRYYGVPSPGARAETNEVLVFITATLIDPVGNRIHSDDEMPFAKAQVPVQPKESQ